ncbi:MAG: hypothetical protein PHX62_05155 [Bacilli bacterium]|nr:hypothetical protein [Bacilli bacterium]
MNKSNLTLSIFTNLRSFLDKGKIPEKMVFSAKGSGNGGAAETVWLKLNIKTINN